MHDGKGRMKMNNFVKITNIHDHMVFQQQDGAADITVRGFIDCAQGEGVVYAGLRREENNTWAVPWQKAVRSGDTYTVTLHAPAGGPYTLRTKLGGENETGLGGGNGEVRFHLGVGDLWVIAGQSNATGFGQTPASDTPDPRLKLFSLGRTWRDATHPLSDGGNYPFTVVEEWCLTGNSAFVSFGNAVVREINCPVGLLQTAQGGAELASWADDGALYRNMLDVISAAGGRVRGILWYQGCSDAADKHKAETYLERFSAFVQSMRRALGDPSLPFVTVQLDKFFLPMPEPMDEGFSIVKEAQRQAARILNDVYVVPTHDLPINDLAHLSSAAQQQLGQRLSWLALENVYHKPYIGQSPDVRDIAYSGKTATVTFDHAPHGFGCVTGLPAFNSFMFEDEQGEVGIEAMDYDRSSIRFTLSREPVGCLLGSMAVGCSCLTLSPMETLTGNPPLAYFRVRAHAC